MKIVRSLKLWLSEGTSDKVYELDLVDTESPDAEVRFLVNFRFGRRGQLLKEGTKTPTPVSRDTAEKIFDSVVVARVNDGYRSTESGSQPDADTPAAANTLAPESPEGRAKALLAHLDACVRNPWPEKQRDRLFWRVGELRLSAAAPYLLQLARIIGHLRASYSLVWALARCAGGEAADVLRGTASEARVPLVRGLANFALISPLMGGSRLAVQPSAPLPEGIAQAITVRTSAKTTAQADLDLTVIAPAGRVAAKFDLRRLEALHGALMDYAQRQPARVGAVMIELYCLAQADALLHSLLVALVARLPARPPFVPGLRRLFKYAEMIDDAAMFGVAAQRFDTAKPMYRTAYSQHAYIPELSQPRGVKLTHLTGAADARTALSEPTLFYLKRRIWRALRKRGELGQESFLSLATGYLLAFTETDTSEPRTESFYRWDRESRRGVTSQHYYGPLAHAWGVGQLMYRHSANVRLRAGSLTYLWESEPNADERGEAFHELWDAHPEYALRLAAESRCEPVATFGARILRDNGGYLRGIPSGDLEALLGSPYAPVVRLALDEARNRLGMGIADAGLVGALLASALAEARDMAIARIDLEPESPWTSPRLAFLAVTSEHEDVRAAALKWCSERPLLPEAGKTLAGHIASWLLASPAADSIKHMRRCLPLLWPAHDLPLEPAAIGQLMACAIPEVVAAGVDILKLSGADASSLPDTVWQQLLHAEAAEIQAAALGMLGGLSDEQLADRAFLIMAMATATAPEVRQAARPLVSRLASRFPRFADDLARRLIDLAFQSAPDDAYAGDIVALFREALPERLAALDRNLIWRLLHAQANGAQLLGANALVRQQPYTYSVRQLARLGNHRHAIVREWVKAAYNESPIRIGREAADAVLLIESEWEDTRAFAIEYFEHRWDHVWSPEVLAVIADSTRPEILAYARSVLRRTMNPGDASTQLVRLLEHPATSMHLLISEVLTAEAAQDETVFAKLLPLARIILLQVHKGRVAKDRIGAFLHAEALKSRERATAIAPVFTDLSLSVLEHDRTRAVTALRDIDNAWPGLLVTAPLKRVELAVRTA